MAHPPLTQVVPSVPEVHERIGSLLRELHLARRLLTLAKLADQYRELNTNTPAPPAAVPSRDTALAG